jgi:hypothetical protein
MRGPMINDLLTGLGESFLLFEGSLSYLPYLGTRGVF